VITSNYSCAFECRSERDGVATFTGIASTSCEDAYGTVIDPGAFEPIGHVVMLRDHDHTQVIGCWKAFQQRGDDSTKHSI
jgi:hypothetical protein